MRYFQPTTPTSISRAETHVIEDAIETRRRFSRLPHQAEPLEELDLQRQTRDHGVDDALVADEEHAPFAGTEQQERLFEAGIEAGQEEEIGAVLAVAVDGNPRRAGPGQRLIAAPFVFGRIDRGRFRRRDLVGQRHVTQDDVGHPHDPLSDSVNALAAAGSRVATGHSEERSRSRTAYVRAKRDPSPAGSG